MTLTEAENFPSAGCIGSMRWGIDTGRAFDVKGIWRYGRGIFNSDNHQQAAETVLAWDCQWDDETFSFIAPRVIEVWSIGPKHDYMRSERKTFELRNGRLTETPAQGARQLFTSDQQENQHEITLQTALPARP